MVSCWNKSLRNDYCSNNICSEILSKTKSCWNILMGNDYWSNNTCSKMLSKTKFSNTKHQFSEPWTNVLPRYLPLILRPLLPLHYGDVMIGTVASQITSLTVIYSTVWSDSDPRKHQSSALLAFVWGIHPWPVNSPHREPVTRKMFPFDDVIIVR